MKKQSEKRIWLPCRLLCILAALLWGADSHADYVSLTGAETAANIVEIELDRDSLHLVVEISAAEARQFWPGIDDTDNLQDLAVNAAKAKNWQLAVRAGNTALSPVHYRVSVAERTQRTSPFAGKTDPRTGQILPDFPTDKTVLKVHAKYHLPGADHITLTPPLDTSGLATTNIGFITRHGATVVNNFAYLSRAETLLIDWSDPWNTRYENPNIRRHNRAPAMSFLYIEPRQVRHDILLRPSKLAEWTRQSFDAWQPLTQATRQKLATAAKHYLGTKNPTSIDGRSIAPASIETVFLKATDAGFALVPTSEPIELGSVMVGYRENFALEQLPSAVNVHWQLFDDHLSMVPTLIQDPAGTFPTHVTTTFPTIEWQNFLQQYIEPVSATVPAHTQRLLVPSLLPLLAITILLLITLSRYYPAQWRWFRRTLTNTAIGLAIIVAGFLILPARFATPLPWPASDRQLTAVTQALLTEVAIAYQEREESRLNATLSGLISASTLRITAYNLASVYQPSTSVGGAGLTRTISELHLQQLERIEIAGNPAFRAIAQWRANVEGHYWGHSDRRQYQIRADLEIRQEGENWKIAAFTPLKIH